MIITGKKFSKPKLSRIINGDDELKQEDERPEKFRLDHLLVKQHPEYNRSSLQKFIASGFVTVDGEPAKKPNAKFLPDAQIELHVPEQAPLPDRPPVIYEDDHVLVLDKPSGLLSTAKGEFCPEPTLENYGLLVHRLDRDTSGVVILAKDPETQSMLRRQFQDRKTHKTYYAIVEGRPKLPEALIDLPIARNMKRPTTFIIDQNGKPSQTYYKVLKSNDRYSLLELKPTTGRTHQLRVHLKYLGTPIAGDPVYGDEKTAKHQTTSNSLTSSPKSTKHQTANSSTPSPKSTNHQTSSANHPPVQKTSAGAPRLMLHAGSLEITIPSPDGNLRKTFTSPLPPEFSQLV